MVHSLWMLILDFGHPRAMVSGFFKSPWLWDGIFHINCIKYIIHSADRREVDVILISLSNERNQNFPYRKK